MELFEATGSTYSVLRAHISCTGIIVETVDQHGESIENTSQEMHMEPNDGPIHGNNATSYSGCFSDRTSFIRSSLNVIAWHSAHHTKKEWNR